jgi:hypothetical protein
VARVLHRCSGCVIRSPDSNVKQPRHRHCNPLACPFHDLRERRTCPGRGAAFFMMHRRAGTHRRVEWSMDPGSAAHRFALRSIRGTLTHFRHPATRCAPELLLQSLAQQRAWRYPKGGAGNAGRSTRPQPRVQSVESTRVRHHGCAEITRHSRTRMVLTVSFALSPVIGLFVTVTSQTLLRSLTPTIEASGPHDFAVRVSAVRLRRIRVHRIPSPTSVTMAKRPSCGPGRERYGCDLGQKGMEKFLQRGLDDPNHLDPLQQIRLCAQVHLSLG